MKVIQPAKSLEYIFREYWTKEMKGGQSGKKKEWDAAEISFSWVRTAAILQDVCISF